MDRRSDSAKDRHLVRDGANWHPTGSWPATSAILAPPFDTVAIDLTKIWL